MSSKPARVGVLGIAGISCKTVIAIGHDESNCEIRAVASRSMDKAQNFVQDFFPKDNSVQVFGGDGAYDSLITSTLLDAIYIPLPAAVKKDWVIKALKAGKHVVVEKPVALSSADYAAILRLAYEKGKFVLDGTMFPHHPRTHDILELIAGNDSRVGEVQRVQCNFSFLTDEAWENADIRARKDGDPQGCLGDLGWYCIRFGLLVFQKLGSSPLSVQVVDVDLNRNSVPRDATCIVRFQNKRALWFHCSFTTAFRQHFEICGNKEFVTLYDLVLPRKGPSTYNLTSSGLTEHDLLTLHEHDTIQVNGETAHEVLLWKTFSRISRGIEASPTSPSLSGWSGNDPKLAAEANDWASVSFDTQRILDALMASINQGCTSVDL